MAEARWEQGYQPWSLVARAMMTLGKQAAILIFTYSQVCDWNSNSHQVMMNCREDWVGHWAYPCEATKAFARSFPLIAASISMTTAARFIMQSRLFYHLIRRGALLDYDNYKATGDALVLVLAVCFLCSMLHFALDLFLPPFKTWQKLSDIGTVYIAPCCVFFVLFESLSDVERHFVPLTRFYEEDPAWAKAHLAKSEMYQEGTVRKGAEAGRACLRSTHGRETYELDELLDETLKGADLHVRMLTNEEQQPTAQKRPAFRLTLFKGLWPGRLLLDERLCDKESVNFRRAWLFFYVVFVLVQAVVVGLLLDSAWQRAIASLPENFPVDAVEVEGQFYQRIGEGYCRQDSMERPYGYYAPLGDLQGTPQAFQQLQRRAGKFRSQQAAAEAMALDTNPFKPLVESHKMSAEGLACAKHCSESGNCVAYALDLDLCNIYLRLAVNSPVPQGWHAFSENPGAGSRWNLPSVVVQTNGAMGAECWAKLDAKGEPQDIGGCVVHLLHAVFVIGVAALSLWLV